MTALKELHEYEADEAALRSIPTTSKGYGEALRALARIGVLEYLHGVGEGMGERAIRTRAEFEDIFSRSRS